MTPLSLFLFFVAAGAGLLVLGLFVLLLAGVAFYCLGTLKR